MFLFFMKLIKKINYQFKPKNKIKTKRIYINFCESLCMSSQN